MTDSAYAEWLQLPERTATNEDTAQTSKWGALARVWTASSCFAGEGAAAAEAARVLAFANGPLVEERVTIAGRVDVAAVRGRVITITQAADPAYAAGADVFCLGGDCDHGSGITHFDVLRRL
jgi:hypothetical protein